MAQFDITVGVRVCPLNNREVFLCSSSCVDVQGSNIYVLSQTKPASKTQFLFDQAWACNHEDPSNASQARVFSDVGLEVVKCITEGHNTCVLAYGQSGSGKTHTMMGSVTDPGLVPRICQALLQIMEQETRTDIQHRFQLSYMEIYNEKISDLLVPSHQEIDGGRKIFTPSKGTPCKLQRIVINKSIKLFAKKLFKTPKYLPKKMQAQSIFEKSNHRRTVTPNKLHIQRNHEKGINIPNLTQVWVASYKEVEEHLHAGNARRSTAQILGNSHSSRGHSVITLTYTRTVVTHDASRKTVSKLHLVDLAGRDSLTGASGARLTEGRHINRSLSALSKVLYTLSEGGKAAAHVPYRDSLLTQLLQDSLGGNSKTFMIATISPASCNYTETLTTLRCVAGAKRIRTSPTPSTRPYTNASKCIRTLPPPVRTLRYATESITTLPTITPDPKMKNQGIELFGSQFQQRMKILLETTQFIIAELEKIKKGQDALEVETEETLLPHEEELVRRHNEHLQGNYSQTDFRNSLEWSDPGFQQEHLYLWSRYANINSL